MNTPNATIHGPSFDTPSTGRSGATGTDVSMSATANAPNTSKAIPKLSTVAGGRTLNRCAAKIPAARSTVANETSLFSSVNMRW